MSNETVITSLKEKIDDLNQQAWDVRISDSPKSLLLSNEAVKLARSINYAKGLAEGLQNCALGYIRTSKNDEAVIVLKEALLLFRSLNDLKGQAIVYEYLGIVERNWGNLGGSLEILFKALALTEQIKIKEIEAASNYQIAVTYKHLGDFEKALDHLYQAIAASREMRSSLFESYAINVIGSIYFETGDYKKALDYYLQGLVARHEAGDKWGEAGSLDNIGFTYLKLQDYQQAIDYCKKSLEITRSTGDKKGQANTLLHLAEIYKQSNNEELAAKFCNESLQIRQASGDKKGEAEILLFLADLHKTQPENDKNILEWLNNSLKIAEEMKAVDLLSKTRFHLYEYYKQKGNFEEALKNLDLHTNLEKEFHKNAINQKVSNLEISHKAEAISQRNKELTELNEQIEKANAELKIEASLERVRAVAMGMKEPADMINVCRMISDQLLMLGFKEIRNVQTVIIYPQRHEYLNYQYFTPYDKDSIETIDYRLHPDVLEFTNQMLSSPDAYYNKTFEGEELRVWREYRKQTNQLHDPKLDECTSSHYYFYSIGSGALGVTTYAPLSDEQIELFKRFRNVFALAYRRFIDIENALAQAREAQIEVSLEKVRSRTMAMQKSDELREVVTVVFEQLLHLGFPSDGCAIILYNKANLSSEYWMVIPGNALSQNFTVPYFDHPYYKEELDAWEKRVSYQTFLYEGELKKSFEQFFLNHSPLIDLPADVIEAMTSTERAVASIAFMDYGSLSVMGAEPLSEVNAEILQRFTKVFDQTYTRFLDLQKAEAQTREAQIEVAVERVRAKALAMHRSEDLHSVVVTLKKELMGLQIPDITAATIYLAQDDGSIRILDLSDTGGDDDDKPQLKLDKVFRLEDTDPDLWIRRMWYHNENYFVLEADEDDFGRVIQWIRTVDPIGAEIAEKIIREKSIKKAWLPTVKLEKGIINIDLLAPPSSEVESILMKMGAGFDLAYKRFLDLQKAEAQAKEAQTEVALERIRARAMAMHSSNELMDVAHILREQMGLLDQADLETSVVNLFDEDSDLIHSWHAFREPGSPSGKTINGTVSFRKDSSELTKEMIGHYHSGKKEYTLEATGEKLNEFIQVLINSEPEISNYIGKHPPEKVYYHFATFTGGALLTVSYQPTTEDIKSLQRRAASVFDMAYRRYRDLKKAEAQTREAQIEIAVERVRAKALAMHKSEEILSVVVVLRNELLSLNIPGVSGTTIYLKQDDGRIRMWDLTSVIELEDGFHLSMDIVFPLIETHPELFIRKIWNATEKYSVQLQNRDDLMRTVEWLAQYKKEEAENVKRFIESSDLKNLFHSTVPLANGKLSVDLMEPPPAEMESILQKMATAFDLAYKRFLDLQKAEAQAREAQIETALEKIRTHTMGMRSSEDLANVATAMFDQMRILGGDLFSFGIVLCDKHENIVEQWHSIPHAGMLAPFLVPVDLDYIHRYRYDQWKAGVELFSVVIPEDYIAEHFELMMKLPSVKEVWEGIAAKGIPLPPIPTWEIDYGASFKYGYLLVSALKPFEEEKIFPRFAKVFEQTYTRFLDLQKAEAQAREAEIELALERVRSRAMAMHSSQELKDVATELRNQMSALGQTDMEICAIHLYDESPDYFESIAAGPVFDSTLKAIQVQVQVKLPKQGIQIIEEMMNQYHSGKKDYVLINHGKKGVEWFELLKEKVPLAYEFVIQNLKETSLEDLIYYWSISDFKGGSLVMTTYVPPADEVRKILRRFANVFGLAYQRFKDLKKAEEQAREAQIESGLERVRSKTMAMHKSEEVTGVAVSLNEELLKLGFEGGSTIIIIDRETGDTEQWTGFSADKSLKSCFVPYFKHPCHDALLDAWKKAEKFLVYTLTGDEKRSLDEHYFTTGYKDFPETDKRWMRQLESVTFSHALMKYGAIHWGPHHLSEEQLRILQKFSKVFEQSYTRFLDLQKAEAQAREAQIEAALERVRAKVMTMTNSKDLNETSLVFGEQLRKLGIDWQFSYFWLIDESKNENTFWITWPDYKTSLTSYTLAEAEEYFNDCLISWRAGVKIHDNYVPPEGVQEWLDTFQRIADDAGGEAKRIMVPKTFPNGVYYYDAMMKYGSFGICISKPATDEEKNIQCRFAIEFERAYTRFLDLKQAEAQTRESQIELGLERVRARAMAMQKSDELKELIGTVSTELSKLDLILDRCFIAIFDAKTHSSKWWMAAPETPSNPIGLTMQYHEMPPYLAYLDAWKTRQLRWQYILEGEIKNEWDEFTFSETEFSHLPDFVIANMRGNNKVYLNASFNSFGCLTLATLEPLSGEHFDIMLRFAKVFDLTYTRFNDLKQAEAQTRESQIELGLERVRARAMAMQKSDELKELIGTVYTELTKLDLILDRCFIMIYDTKSMGVTWWMSNPEAPLKPVGLFVKYHEQPPYQAFINAWKERDLKWHYILEGTVKKNWDSFLFVETDLSLLPDFVIANMKSNEKVYLSASFNNFGCLTLATIEPLSDEHFDLLLRFAKVFDLTYTRFNDLKQAEAQAREAKIEAALERVRARAMAMHKSEDLNPAVATVFEELDKLNLGLIRCGIAILDKEKPRSDIWITIKSDEGSAIQVSGDEPLDIHPLLKGTYDAWRKQEDFSYVLQDDDLLSYYQAITKTNFQLPISANLNTENKDQHQYYFNAVFQDGSLFAFLDTAFTDEARMIMKRFANVFNLTYKRFLDLQKAEAQTREALIEGALERVRARALAMQQPEELKEVAEVLRIEMGLLGIEELETCSIYIHDVSAEKAECWYALKDIRQEEKKLVNDHFALNLNDTWVGRQMLSFYDSNEKQTSIVMQGENRKEWIRYCEEKSVPFRGYYGEVIPDRTYHLYRFSHGAIGAAAAGDISAESWKLLSRAASVFSLAYSRFKDLTQARNDLIQLKEEKKRAEDALTELQATQKQLIQSEKMASLGELTAGIAHEIQNPLNFVNNFSDVSNELLEEMKQELATGNTQQAIELVNDVKENLEKILHHGKRADAIVKGMLQHSRSSSGQKEPTDINVLAEEYLRLAYHGLRAKDKFFNAKFETDLDPSINKINIVPQEIGRVILNLINNSFYAVSEKKKNSPNGYEPIVTVSTKAVKPPPGSRGLAVVEIRVKDNGNGIPQKVLDKIFQPFFTTKPTGQGTGLGLSLSYDIITKGHDGEIKVETKQGEGSEFIISLPVN